QDMNAAYREIFSKDFPARATVGTGLMGADANRAIMFTGVKEIVGAVGMGTGGLGLARSQAQSQSKVPPPSQSRVPTQSPASSPYTREAAAIACAERSVSATKVSVPFVQPPVGSVGAPTTNRFS